MKTIGERAIEYAYKEWPLDFIDVAIDSYETGATEQKAIDDELCKSGEASDGYHTFNEFYYYRMLYNAAFFNKLAHYDNIADGSWKVEYDVHKSKKHSDGEDCFGGGWFIVMAEAIKLKKPKYYFCGHIHDGNHKVETIDNTLMANVSLLNDSYQISYEPLYLDI